MQKTKKYLSFLHAEIYKLKIEHSYTPIVHSINRVICPTKIDLLCSQPIPVALTRLVDRRAIMPRVIKLKSRQTEINYSKMVTLKIPPNTSPKT